MDVQEHKQHQTKEENYSKKSPNDYFGLYQEFFLMFWDRKISEMRSKTTSPRYRLEIVKQSQYNHSCGYNMYIWCIIQTKGPSP